VGDDLEAGAAQHRRTARRVRRPPVAAPVRHLFRKQPNVTTLLGEVASVDAAARRLRLTDATTLPYDHLILAAGGPTGVEMAGTMAEIARQTPCPASSGASTRAGRA